MKIYYFSTHLEIWKEVKLMFYKPWWELACAAHSLGDISEEIFEKLTEDQVDMVYYFFHDLETL